MRRRLDPERRIARICTLGAFAGCASLFIAWKLSKWHWLALPFEQPCWPPLSPTRLACIPSAAFAIIAIACAVVALASFAIAAVVAWRSRRSVRGDVATPALSAHERKSRRKAGLS